MLINISKLPLTDVQVPFLALAQAVISANQCRPTLCPADS